LQKAVQGTNSREELIIDGHLLQQVGNETVSGVASTNGTARSPAQHFEGKKKIEKPA